MVWHVDSPPGPETVIVYSVERTSEILCEPKSVADTQPEVTAVELPSESLLWIIISEAAVVSHESVVGPPPFGSVDGSALRMQDGG